MTGGRRREKQPNKSNSCRGFFKLFQSPRASVFMSEEEWNGKRKLVRTLWNGRERETEPRTINPFPSVLLCWWRHKSHEITQLSSRSRFRSGHSIKWNHKTAFSAGRSLNAWDESQTNVLRNKLTKLPNFIFNFNKCNLIGKFWLPFQCASAFHFMVGIATAALVWETSVSRHNCVTVFVWV